MATLTYVYTNSTAVLGPLATYAEPHCYDLCVAHSERLTAPRRWEVSGSPRTPPISARPATTSRRSLTPSVRRPARRRTPPEDLAGPVEVGRRGHLRMLRSPDSAPG